MEAIGKAGLQLIYEKGYEAMSLRHLATEVGIQVGSLYNHISTKQDLLFGLLRKHMENLLESLDKALIPAGDPHQKLQTFVAFHVRYHIARKREVFICYSELRSLDPENYEVIVAMRRAYEERLIAILKDGLAQGRFSVADPQVAAYGILAMLTGVCTWFRPKGRLSAEDVATLYTGMVLDAVGDKTPRAASLPGEA
ncbi:TetR/AcrR family transcriptional regulator [Magnetospirillum molischianum]|uniref:Putative transcriptional regulatory protein, TetR family n=1 Tax=Magnetospirillum molischianum DSM 120 TaxID=1150626 RepID=H8FS87_MAGML|nr:TetR/AcrR family transcriptional regulator [Magnetospirillum molischianum]CCG41225.1 putative transcriptional regulatory protein, TetR family [Magnetospirillum molischianum DSM 120]